MYFIFLMIIFFSVRNILSLFIVIILLIFRFNICIHLFEPDTYLIKLPLISFVLFFI